MKRILAFVLAALLLTGCAAKTEKNEPAEAASPEVSAAPAAEEKPVEEPIVKEETTQISAEKASGNTIELTVPADFIGEEVTQEDLDAEAGKTDGFISATLNADGSATYVMTEKRHNDLMTELGQNINTELTNMADSSDYPNVVSVSASSDYKAFTVTLSTDTVGLQESFLVMAFYMYGGMYNAFNGTPADNVSVQFVNQSGTVLESANSRDMQ